MKTVNIYKAQRTTQSQDVPSVEIVIDEDVPNFHTTEAADDLYELQAERLCDALEACLPGGTFDHLLIQLMKRKASRFKVSHKE